MAVLPLGVVDGVMGAVVAGLLVSSTFFPQPPSAKSADRATATAARGFNLDAYISVPS